MSGTSGGFIERMATKALHIAPTPFFSNRGCHIRIRNEIDGEKFHGIKVVLCTYHHGKDVPGIDIRRIPSVPGYTKADAGYSPYKFIADIFLFFLVLKTVLKERPDIIHGHLHEGALLGWAASILFFWRKMPLVMDMQGSLSGELKSYGVIHARPRLHGLVFAVEKWICTLPSHIVCSSNNSLRFLLDKCNLQGGGASVLQDVVPQEFLVPKDKEKQRELHGVPSGKRVIIYTGSLLPGKGIDTLLDATGLLLSTRSDLFFVYVGYPRETVAEYVRNHGLEDHCLVAGEVPYGELSFWLASADLAVDPKMADSGEASGKIIHYMASSLPVVCFDSENNRNFLGQAGYYSKAASAEGLAAAIEHALSDHSDWIRRGSIGLEKVKKEHSLFSAGARLKELYKELLR